MKMLVVCIALATLVAPPAFAQESNNHMSAARTGAIRQCSVAAARYTEHTWGDMEIQQYRTCMAVSSQVE